jgi:hypothetical protein
METRLDRPDRPAKSFGDAFEWEVGPETEDHHDPLVGRQSAKARQQCVPLDERRKGIPARAFRLTLDRDEADNVSPPQPVPATVDQDPIEPRTELVGFAQRVERLPGDDQGVLNGVLGLMGIGEEEAGQPVGPIEPGPRRREKPRAAAIGGGRQSVGRLVDHDTGLAVNGGIKEHARQCLGNLKSTLEAEGSSLDKVVWANWALRDATEFDTFYEEWVRWFPGDAPVGQGTIMPPLQRRAGFRVSLGVIAQA